MFNCQVNNMHRVSIGVEATCQVGIIQDNLTFA